MEMEEMSDAQLPVNCLYRVVAGSEYTSLLNIFRHITSQIFYIKFS